MISTVKMCDRIQEALRRRRMTILRRDNRIVILEARVKRLAARIVRLNELLGLWRDAERARRAEIRDLRRRQMRLPL